MVNRRVYEVATELGVRSSVVMRVLRDSGGPVTSASASLTPAQVEEVRAALRAEKANPRPRSKPSPSPREPETYRTSTPPRWVPVTGLSVLEHVVLEHQGGSMRATELHPIEVESIKRTVSEWASEDTAFAKPEALRQWLATGLSPRDAKQCLTAGIAPWMLERRCEIPRKRRPNEILTHGEAIKYEVVTPKRVAKALKEEGLL